MRKSSTIAFSIGLSMIVLTLINNLSIHEVTPTLQRAEIIAALTSISIILVGFLQLDENPIKKSNSNLVGFEGFIINEDLSFEVRNELAWGTQMILTATASCTVLIYNNNQTILKRGLLSETEFSPGTICLSSTKKGKYISLVNTKFYPGKVEFDSIIKDLPSIMVFPIKSNSWLIVGGWSERCFTKSDEVWIDGWSKKISKML
ncbi:cofactor assembly of complex C subunit B [Prochlorococcus sp. SS52]